MIYAIVPIINEYGLAYNGRPFCIHLASHEYAVHL